MTYTINGETVVGFEKLGPEGGQSTTAADAMKTYGQKNSLLEKKAFLQFEYPNTTDPNGPPIMIRLPFFEDPEIRESKSARYASYKPLSRASELFSYLGSDARNFSLTFKLTLPHLANLFNTNKAKAGPQTGDPKQLKAAFFETAGLTPPGDSRIGPQANDYTDAFRPNPYLTKVDDEVLRELGLPFTEAGYRKAYGKKTDIDRANAVKDILVYWVDMIRSSVYNNVSNPIFGPPIVRLNFGMMYRAIPCLVFNYSIAYDPNTGYDKDTLLPRVVKVDMELKEIRAGDFGTFNAAEATTVAGENLAGWESVITTSTNELGGTLDVLPVVSL